MPLPPLLPPPAYYQHPPLLPYHHLSPLWVSPNSHYHHHQQHHSRNQNRSLSRRQQSRRVPHSTAFEEGVMILNSVPVDPVVGGQETRKRMSEQTITSHLKTKVYKKVENSDPDDETCCAICLLDFEDNEQMGVLECRHEFHSNCIKKWLLLNNVCPMCRGRGLQISQ